MILFYHCFFRYNYTPNQSYSPNSKQRECSSPTNHYHDTETKTNTSLTPKRYDKFLRENKSANYWWDIIILLVTWHTCQPLLRPTFRKQPGLYWYKQFLNWFGQTFLRCLESAGLLVWHFLRIYEDENETVFLVRPMELWVKDCNRPTGIVS